MSRRVTRVRGYSTPESRLSLVPVPPVLLSNRCQHSMGLRQRFIEGNCLPCKLYGFRIANLWWEVTTSAHDQVGLCGPRVSEGKGRVLLDRELELVEGFLIFQRSLVPDVSPFEVVCVGLRVSVGFF